MGGIWIHSLLPKILAGVAKKVLDGGIFYPPSLNDLRRSRPRITRIARIRLTPEKQRERKDDRKPTTNEH
jgi:hypothetical protein